MTVSPQVASAAQALQQALALVSVTPQINGALMSFAGYAFDPDFYALAPARNFRGTMTPRNFYAAMPPRTFYQPMPGRTFYVVMAGRTFYAQPRRNMPAIQLPFAKDPREVKTITLDATADLPPGATLTGTPALQVTVMRGADPNPQAAFGTPVINSTAITVPGASAPIAAGMAVQIPALGGVDGCWYEIAVTCNTSAPPITETLKAVLMVSAS